MKLRDGSLIEIVADAKTKPVVRFLGVPARPTIHLAAVDGATAPKKVA
jgi:hypothetical protein